MPGPILRASWEDDVDIRDLFLEQHAAMHPRTAVLSTIALFHSAGHMGEAGTVRTTGGFGPGV